MSHPLEAGARVQSGLALVSLRRALQAVVLGVLLLAPILGLHGVAVDNRWDPAELKSRYGPLAPAASDLAQALLGTPAEGLPGAIVGSTWSIRLFGLELTDPIAAMTLVAGGEAPSARFLLGALLVLGVHLLLGRFFCGYLCPYGALSRLAQRLRAPLARRGWLPTVPLPGWFRFALLGAVLVLPLLGASIVVYALPYLAVGRVLHGLVFGGAASAAGVIVAFLLIDLLLTEHGVCRSICPSGALQHLLGRWRAVRLSPARAVKCGSGCVDCLDACWLGLDPRKALVDPDCDGCLRCAPVCPTTRLGLLVGKPRRWKGTPPLLVTIGGGRTPSRPPAAGGAPATLALLAALGTLSCSGAGAPTVIDGSAPWSSPFMPPAEPERTAIVHMAATTVRGLAFEAGLAFLPEGDEVGVRVYVEEEPGTTWTGPLRILVQAAGGEVEMAFDEATAPRSVPRPSLYEGRLRLTGGATIRAVDGPVAGAALRVDGPGGWSGWPAAAPPALVLCVFLLALPLQRRRRD